MVPLSPVRGIVLLLALLPAPAALGAQTDPAENAVFRAVLAEYIRPETRRLVVSDSTWRLRLDAGWGEGMRRWGGAPELPAGLLESFRLRSAQRVAFPDSLSLPVPVELMSEVELRVIRDGIEQEEWDSQYDALRRRLPGSPGLVSLSRVGFSPEGDLALVHVSLHCGSRCHEGSYLLLRRREGEWRVEQRFGTIRA